ncbi:biliverdin-producing heme oxygenase [Corynebacterium sp. TA-R-1]|uniref:Biliverdin-producing heme oxygenase n=1 Tax=Corynebacterium stercoris TaxID=2943490 RepID=A0ABT1G0Y0_9CORY|nr:biliverdin-producing heme oxygenase [Corynebacterium stercoris]MCP1387685.1 biliverdin-producing heme oxygenase [Corynebacterium stercoris]
MTETLTKPASQQLSEALKAHTAAAHDQAENSRFMAGLAHGELSKDDVTRLTVQYWHIYTALEAAVRRASSHPAVALVADPRLERVPALEADLAALLGADWREHAAATEATEEYVAELNALGAEDGPAVIAHHYVRYLGDISGGQVLARVFAQHYGLEDEALHFYDFAEIGKIPPYRKAYKAALDEMALTEDETTALIETAKRAFGLNMGVFRSLDRAAG